jgi:hypothetical protein
VPRRRLAVGVGAAGESAVGHGDAALVRAASDVSTAGYGTRVRVRTPYHP